MEILQGRNSLVVPKVDRKNIGNRQQAFGKLCESLVDVAGSGAARACSGQPTLGT